MAHCSSINTLLHKLCESIFTKTPKRNEFAYQHQFNYSFQQGNVAKRLKKIVYGILLKFSGTNLSINNISLPGFSEIDCILAYIYHLRTIRHFDDANRLETLLNRLKDEHGVIPDNIRTCLLFLVCLVESDKNSPKIVTNEMNIPKPYFEKDELNILPLEPLQYGDTRRYKKNFYYMHYPSEIFELEMTVSSNNLINENTALFESCPGFDKNGNYLFNLSCVSSEKYIRQPFMGALYQPEKITPKNLLSLSLDLPELKEKAVSTFMEFKLPSRTPVVKNEKLIISEDEGFNETDTPLSSGSGLSNDEDIWDAALKVKRKSYFSWETIGCSVIQKEKPFLTEAGPVATEMIHQAYLYELYLMDPTFSIVPTVTITHESLIRDVFYLLTGVPSKTFLFMKEQMMFTVKSGIHLPGLTPGSTAKLLERFVDSGTEYCRLEKFSSDVNVNICFGQGLVMQAFKGGLQQYLHYYQAMVLYLSQFNFTLMQLDHAFGKLSRQLNFIAKLCNCSSESNINTQLSLPQGLELLSYLYQCAFETWGLDHGILIVFLLKSACAPYLRYLRQWMFEGICNDPYNEFHIEANDMFINTQDESYWTKRFVWKTKESNTTIPLFLTDIAKHIFICGKSLNLLKLCCPQHHMCHTQDISPSLILSISDKMAEYNKQMSKNYESKILEIFQKQQCLREEIDAKKEQEKQKIFAKAHQKLKENMEILKKNQDKLKRVDEERKRQHMEDLKCQIEDNEARRMHEKEILQEEERRLAEQAEQEEEQIEAVRKQIISEYETLSAEVKYEQQKSEWRTKRWELQPERIQNLETIENEEQDNVAVDQIASVEEEDCQPDVPNQDLEDDRSVTENTNQEITESKNIGISIKLGESESKLKIETVVSVKKDYGHPSDSIMSGIIKSTEEVDEMIVSKSSFGHPSDSVIQNIIYNQNDDCNPKLESPSKTTNSNKIDNETEENIADIHHTKICITENKNESKLNTEDTYVDTEVWKTAMYDITNTVLKYRGRNIHGHASDSVIQNLMYNRTAETTKEKSDEDPKAKELNLYVVEEAETTDHLWADYTDSITSSHTYRKDFDMFDKSPLFDILMNISNAKNESDDVDCLEDEKSTQYIPLPILLNRSLLPLLQTQIRLVNKSIISFFMDDLNINNHFIALRNYYFFQDGEFGQMLSQLLFDKIAQCSSPAELLNPPALNSILARSIASSIYADNPLAENFSFAVKFIPTMFPHNASSILNCLELRYKVSWPLNIIITDKSIDQYNLLLGLLLQVKRILWLLNDIWYHLKTVDRCHNTNSLQCRQLQLYRHEMQHFGRVMQSYIASQVLQVTWNSFQTALKNKVFNLDHLRDVHMSYLKKACFRCLLSKKAAPVAKIIQDIFNVIMKFRAQLLVSSWQLNPETHQMEHSSFPLLVASYKIFKEYSSFLYRVLKKLVAKGYQPYLQEFLVTFDVNRYYETTVGTTDVDDIL